MRSGPQKRNKTGEENKDRSTTQISIYSPEDIAAVADKMVELYKKAGSLSEFKKCTAKDIAKAFPLSHVSVRSVTLDIALFCRMVTSDAFRNVEDRRAGRACDHHSRGES